MKEIYKTTFLKIILCMGLLYISFMLMSCERSVTSTCELEIDDQYLFVEYNVLESWSSDDGYGLIIDDGVNYTFNNGILDIRYVNSKPEIDTKTKLLIGIRNEIAPGCGSGIVGGVKALQDYYSTDILSSQYFKNRVEILDCDNKGVITFKLNDHLFKLKSGEIYTETFTMRDFDMNGKRYTFLTDVVSIKNSGFIEKDKVVY